MLGFVPVRGELVRRTDENGGFVDRECLSRLEPCLEGLLGQLLTSAIEQPAPSFVGSQRHEPICVEKRGGGAKLEADCGKIKSVMGRANRDARR
jgi:hypothetical protein